MHRSSSLTPFYQYFALPLVIAIVLYMNVSAWIRDDVWQYYWTHFAAPMSLWLMAWFIVFMVQIRRVQADDSGLTIFSLLGDNTKVNYGDVQYVSEVALLRPRRFFLKYRNPQTSKLKKILVISYARAEMMRYIRQQITKHNPAYSAAQEPSQWATARLAILTSTPFILYAIIQNVITRT